MKDKVAKAITSSSLEALIIYAIIGVGIVYLWLGFELAVLGALAVIAGYAGKIYHQGK